MRIPQKNDKIYIFTSSPFQRGDEKEWLEASIIQEGVRQPGAETISGYGSMGFGANLPGPPAVVSFSPPGNQKDNTADSPKYTVAFVNMDTLNSTKSNRYRSHGNQQTVELRSENFRVGGSSDILDDDDCIQFRWGYQDDTRLGLQILMYRGKNKWHFLQNQDNGKLFRLPSSRDQMIVIGRQHCNEDKLVTCSIFNSLDFTFCTLSESKLSHSG
jgi:hypothetical protein